MQEMSCDIPIQMELSRTQHPWQLRCLCVEGTDHRNEDEDGAIMNDKYDEYIKMSREELVKTLLDRLKTVDTMVVPIHKEVEFGIDVMLLQLDMLKSTGQWTYDPNSLGHIIGIKSMRKTISFLPNADELNKKLDGLIEDEKL